MSAPAASYEVVRTTPAHFAGITSLCQRVYPFNHPWGDDQLQSHQQQFAAGQAVVVETATGEVVGMSASLIVCWDDYETENSWKDFTDHGYFRNHDPVQGRTLYGAEFMVDPAHRGKGLGKMLYRFRKQVVREQKLLRLRAGARLRGYSQHADQMSAREYLLQVAQGQVFDPTISFQIKQGFHIMALVRGYLPNDPETLGWAVVIEWLNGEVARPEDQQRQRDRYGRIFPDLAAEPASLHQAVAAQANDA